MDDFDDETSGNYFGGSEFTQNSGVISFVSTTSVGNTGFSREFHYPAQNSAYNSIRQNKDLSSFRYVSFRIRGIAGGENLLAQVDDNVSFPQVRINNFLPDKITPNFQKVIISTAAFFAAPIDWTGAANGTFAIAGSPAIGTVAGGTIFIDDVRFGDRPSPIFWDNFNDGGSPFNYGKDFESFISPAGASFQVSYDNTLFLGTTGFSYQVVFTSKTETTEALLLIPSKDGGLDVTGTDTLSFHIKGDVHASGSDLGIGIQDAPGVNIAVHLSTYLTGGIPTVFSQVKVPLSDFTTPAPTFNLAEVRSVLFWFEKSGGPLITQTTGFAINLDNIQFIDTSTPTAPTSFRTDGTAVANGTVFGSTNALTVTADNGSTDITLEEVRFEHDGLTGGSTWFTIAVDTNVADTTYATTWYAQSLVESTTYQVRAVASDVQGNIAFTSLFTVEIATIEPKSPGISNFRIFETSASVSLTSNGNPDGTTVTITTGSFEASASSSAFLNTSGVTTLVLSALAPNTELTILTRAFRETNLFSSNTVVATTATLPSPPALSSFTAINVTSITVSWSPNGNPLSPPTSYQVQISTSPDFIGDLTSSTETFAVTATSETLTPNTSYHFRVRAFGVGGSTSEFDTTIDTYTLAAVPGTAVTTFTIVTASSIAVQWVQNLNPPNTLFTLEIATSADFAGLVDSSSTFSTDASTQNLSENANRYFRVKATNQNDLPTPYLFLGSENTTVVSTPAAITSLTALTGFFPGEIELNWIAPGRSDFTGNLLTGSRFHIATTTVLSESVDSVFWNAKRDTAEIQISTADVTPGTTQGTLVQGLRENVQYYFRIWTQNSLGAWSDLSNGATAASQGTVLSVTVDLDTYDFGTFTAVQSTISATTIVLTNDGNVNQRYLLRATTATVGTPWSMGESRGNDIIVLNGLYNSSRPSDADFEAVSSTLAVSEQTSGSGGGRFSGDQTGENVPSQATRNLWFRLGLPQSTSTTDEQSIQVTITAEQNP